MKPASNSTYENLIKMIDEVQDYAIILLDKKGNVKHWNTGAKKIKGYTQEEIIGKHFSIFYTPTDRENSKPQMLLSLAKKEGKATDIGWRIKKNGSSFWADVTITPIHNEAGEIIGYGKLTKDLTESNKAQQAKEMQIKQLEHFAYIASHDLQEPLRTISNFIEILKEDYSTNLDTQAHHYLDTISLASKRMSELVRSLLDYSRLGKGKEKTLIDFKDVYNDVISDLENLITKKKAKITFVGTFPILRGYDVELRQLLQNLVGNSIKFSKDQIPPEIKIGWKKEGDYLRFYIKDNGIGIDAKNYDRVFNIFQRVNVSSQINGYGIGLANCKRIVELHSGTIWIKSKLGTGSTFYFTLANLV